MKSATILGTTLALAFGGAVLAASHANPAAEAALKARKAHMQLYAHNLGILGAMAKGEADYNADAAGAAAGNLAALTKLNQMTYWVPGSDSDSLEGSRSLPAIWNNIDDAIAKGQALSAAADAMVTAASTDLAALQGAMGALGGACGACHKAYRAPNN